MLTVMKTLASLLLLSCGLAPAASAQQAGRLGAGVLLGSPIGGTAKYWFKDTQGADVGIGTDGGDFTFWGDYSWHSWDILPQPRKGTLGASLSLGGRFRDKSDEEFGFRTLAGASYWFPTNPLELFLEFGPRFDVDGDVEFDGGVGVRYYFGRR